MNRYVVTADLQTEVSSIDTVVEDYLVIDLTGSYVIAHCGPTIGRAQKVADALNAYDGGPLS